MVILEESLVSDLLRDTIIANNWPVLSNEVSIPIFQKYNLLLEKEAFISYAKTQKKPLFYTNSKKSYKWIVEHLEDFFCADVIKLFRNKTHFRTLLKDLYPDFFFRKIPFSRLFHLNPEKLKYPCVIKPNQGNGSIGVFVLENSDQFYQAIVNIRHLKEHKDHVSDDLDLDTFLIEEKIEGEQYAVEVYFDDNKLPVILNILQHIPMYSHDISDTLYISSTEIISQNYAKINECICKMNKYFSIKNTPFIVEFIKNKKSEMIPIEFNPMRFNGLCESDFAYYAYGINCYEFFFHNKKPHWESIVSETKNTIYSIITLSRKTSKIQHINFNDKGFLSCFDNVLYKKNINVKNCPYYGIFYIESQKENFWEEINHAFRSGY